MAEPTPEPWHLDKRVPIALILTLAVQTGGMVWWAASISARVDNHTEQIGLLRGRDTERTTEERRIAEAIARFDERLRAQTEILQRLDRAMTPSRNPPP